MRPQGTNVKIKLLILGVILTICLGGGIGAYVYFKKKNDITPAEAYEHGLKNLKNRNYQHALYLFNKAVTGDPQKAEYHWELSKLQLGMRKKSDSLQHAKSAWDLGLKKPDVLKMLVTLDDSTGKDRIAKTMAMVAELEKGSVENEEEFIGDIYFTYKDNDKALEIWLKSFIDNQTEGLAEKISSAYLHQGRMKDSLVFLDKNRKVLQEKGYLHYLTLLTLAGDFKVLEDTYEEAKNKKIYGPLIRLSKAIYHYNENKRDIAKAIFMELLEEGKSANTEEDSSWQYTLHQSRLHVASMLFIDKKRDEILKLKDGLDLNKREQEGESYLFTALSKEGEKLPWIEGEMEKAWKLLPDHPVVSFFQAESLIIGGKWGEAEKSLDNLLKRHPQYGINPFIVLEVAKVKTALGKNKQALEILRRMHARGVYFKTSLQLFRDLSVRLKLKDHSLGAQKVLEEIFPNDSQTLLEGGLLSMSWERYDEAQNTFDKISADAPQQDRVIVAKVAMELSRKDYSKAMELLDHSGLELDQIAVLRSKALRGQTKIEEALKLLEGIDQSKRNDDIKAELADIYLLLGQLDQANELFNELAKKYPDNASMLLGLAFVNFQQGKFDESEEFIMKAMRNDERNSKAIFMLAQIDLVKGRIDSALGHSEKVLSNDPENNAAKYLKATCLFRKGEAKSAERILASLVQKVPNWKEAKLLLGSVYFMLNDLDKADHLFMALEKEYPADATIKLAVFQLDVRQKRNSKAEKSLEDLKKGRSEEFYVTNKAWIMNQKGEVENALALLEANIQFPAVALLWLELGMPTIADKAWSFFEKQDFPVEVWVRLASLSDRHQQIALSEKLYKKAVTLRPDDANLLNNYAWMASQNSGVEQGEVVKLARKAQELSPNDLQILDTCATIYDKYEKYSEQVTLLIKKMTLAKNDARLMYFLGKAQFKLDDQKAAIKSLEESQRLLQFIEENPLPISKQELQELIEENRKG